MVGPGIRSCSRQQVRHGPAIEASLFFSCPCELFCAVVKLKCFPFYRFRTLCKKQGGGGCPRSALLRLHRTQEESFRPLTHFGKCADLSFQSLIVLPLDLKFGLQLFDQQVQVRNLHAELLDVRHCRRRPNLPGIWCLGILLRWQGLPRGESLGKGARPYRFRHCGGWRRSRNRAWGCRSRRRWCK
jgi:hypothetical protein